jgi:SAM-dependent methyltransferase
MAGSPNVSVRDADYFDGWYPDKLAASVLERAKQRHLGHPPELLGTSLLTMSGVREVADALRLSAGRRLLDLACGSGAFGCWIAQETGCDVVGVDFSTVAVEHARSSASGFGLHGRRAEFRVGDLTATGLADESVDAVMVVDSIQFASGSAVAAEARRVLRPGGRIAITGWEPVDRSDPVHSDRIRNCDPDEALRSAGFAEVRVAERPQWLDAERAYWADIVTHDPAEHPALPSAISEGQRSLAAWGTLRRVFATATRP